ncbi:hypothetical protein RclHR1_00780021 [Rhizophagus clarus]|uniref:Uncharacterized protein n=1 Tax=Rhizophagus clarus TaxID=94130 RepID=A0A2Z6S0A7_9GLOM|nr:hypothetical protein RclHR1_00780021 [Rhizophagus clarus]GES87361.1 hypothetical protein GLOIN_2v1526472 [Rhizophagus clarus]
MSEHEQKLSILKGCFDMECITVELYNEYSRRIFEGWFKNERFFNHVEIGNMSELEQRESMSELKRKLSILKRWVDMGYMNESLRDEYSRRILEAWSEEPCDERPFWKRILEKAISFGHIVLANLISLFGGRITTG